MKDELMDDEELKFRDVYNISEMNRYEHLCEIIFTVRQFSSTKDDLYNTKVTVDCNLKGYNSRVENFDFGVHENNSKVCTIIDFMLPVELRGHRIAMFILNTVYNYLLPEIKLSFPMVNGSLIAKDNQRNRDKMYQKLTGYDTQHPLAIFQVDSSGQGYFEGQFLDVGDSWRQSIAVSQKEIVTLC